MRVKILPLSVLFASALALQPAAGQQFTGIKELAEKARAIDIKSDICTVSSIGKSAAGNDIQVITIGKGDKDSKPGIAVVAGVDGAYLLGREIALGLTETLINDASKPEIALLLDKVTFYIFPDVNPDATSQYFSSLKYERSANGVPTDDDRDFVTDEDPLQDMNGDGIITAIRISDPSGSWKEDNDDPRVMVTADLSKGETGKYIIITEGTDDDKDGKFNEDGAGGVAFNRNLTYNYEEYGLNTGLHPVSETETKAVADFLFDHYNIYATIAFGPQDNLGQPLKAQGQQGAAQGAAQGGARPQNADRRFSSIMKSDETINKLVSDKYHEITGLKGAPPSKQTQGNFMDWSYFHYGRYSYSVPGWWFPIEKEKSPEVSFLKYATENNLTGVFTEWSEVKHPDFPGKKAEVGGIAPFVMTNPPSGQIAGMVTGNVKFILEVAGMHPELEFTDIKTEKPGGEVYRLTLKVYNKGLFATMAEAGLSNIFTRLPRITVETSGNQKILSGQKVQRMQRLEGGASVEYSWLISGNGKVKITAGAVNTGIISTVAELK